MISRGHVVLTAIDRANLETVRAWIADSRINQWMVAGHLPITAEAELRWYDASDAASAAGTGYDFEIHAAEDMRLLGHCGLMEINRIDAHGEVGIFIGDVAEHGKGFGRDAIVALLGFAFDTLGLHTVRIRAIDGNARAVALYRSIGFRDAGTWREGRYVRGCFHDVILLDMTRSEYDARYAG